MGVLPAYIKTVTFNKHWRYALEAPSVRYDAARGLSLGGGESRGENIPRGTFTEASLMRIQPVRHPRLNQVNFLRAN